MTMEDEQTKKEEEYSSYINAHIANVKLVWKVIQDQLVGEFWLDDFVWHEIDSLIKHHDESKFSLEEFDAYRQYFYPIDNATKNERFFNQGWLHHIHNNPHHWEYWIIPGVKNNVLPMHFVFAFEMLCDWCAMSVKFRNKPSEWYNDNKPKMLLHDKTVETVEHWLPIFDEVYSRIIQKKRTNNG